jgi:hypothetical protein
MTSRQPLSAAERKALELTPAQRAEVARRVAAGEVRVAGAPAVERERLEAVLRLATAEATEPR